MKKQNGMALLIVLLIVSMMAALAVNISGKSQKSIRKTINLAVLDQGYWYAIAGESLAKKVLHDDFEDQKKNHKNNDERADAVYLDQKWATKDVVYPVEYGKISGNIKDMSACFNVNALIKAAKKDANGQDSLTVVGTQFMDLLINSGIDSYSAEILTYRVFDYLNPKGAASQLGVGNDEYLTRTFPYNTPKGRIQHQSELRAVMGFTNVIYQKVAPYLCANPWSLGQVLNVNTVEDAALLAATFENKLSISEAERIIGSRSSKGYKDLDTFFSDTNTTDLVATLRNVFSTSSDYFLFYAEAEVDGRSFRTTSIINRGSENRMLVKMRQLGWQK